MKPGELDSQPIFEQIGGKNEMGEKKTKLHLCILSILLMFLAPLGQSLLETNEIHQTPAPDLGGSLSHGVRRHLQLRCQRRRRGGAGPFGGGARVGGADSRPWPREA